MIAVVLVLGTWGLSDEENFPFLRKSFANDVKAEGNEVALEASLKGAETGWSPYTALITFRRRCNNGFVRSPPLIATHFEARKALVATGDDCDCDGVYE